MVQLGYTRLRQHHSQDIAPSPALCVSALAHAVVSISSATTLLSDPMDLDTNALAGMPHGTKRDLSKVY